MIFLHVFFVIKFIYNPGDDGFLKDYLLCNKFLTYWWPLTIVVIIVFGDEPFLSPNLT